MANLKLAKTEDELKGMDDNFKICHICKRNLPNDRDHFYLKNGKLINQCKECKGRKFTNNLSRPIAPTGFAVCKECNRVLPENSMYFEVKTSNKNGLYSVCRECRGGNFKSKIRRHQTWKEQDDELLIQNYSKFTGEELQSKFFPNRTVRAIECRASELGCQGKDVETTLRRYKIHGQKISKLEKGVPKTVEQRKKQSDAMFEYYKTHEPWWKGKKRSVEQCKAMSERQKGKWGGDKNPRHLNPLFKEKNGRWKGGTTPIYWELRKYTKDWQALSMKFCEYKCIITGSSFDNIHHTTPFRQLVDEVFAQTKIEMKQQVSDYTQDEISQLRLCLIEKHNFYGFGACLNYKVHKLFHDEYGYINTTIWDFLDFVQRIANKEYDKWFCSNKLEIDINYTYVNYLKKIIQNFKKEVV